MGLTDELKRDGGQCKHVWGDEQGERKLDYFMWWRVCGKCGKERATRAASRGAVIEIWDMVSGIRHVIGSRQNLASKEFRYLHCECGNTLRVDFNVADNGRVTRKKSVACDWCGARYSTGSSGPEHRPRAALWDDAPDVA